MSKIQIENQGKVAVLTLNNGITNAINPELVKDLSEAFNNIRNQAKAMVLCGGTKFFSIGLDLPTLMKLDRSEMTDFWHKFNHLLFDLYTIPLPTVCAVSGHAVAGGNVLALVCDYRFGNADTKKIGLNEIRLGLPVPYLADMMLRQLVSERAATQMIYSGEFMSFSDAKKIGLIDETYTTETLKQHSVEKAAELSALQNQAFSAVKANRIEEIKTRYEKNWKSKNELFLDSWFSEPTQKMLKDAAQKF
ncbi:enoyl-CoA hydratase/isomerase family protein [Desulfonema magnum]|uniref:Enoyl-CoA hydratase/isomerase n=1 Tax=Desulfonema magnum TaxID=45655 RepID=A0A975GK69_9BACT|nr:enoyl-CoA hydratase/isomerase family protein [Desulfonema magnum]QTA84312.1 Enoyl-CoA hydratase/isomerase [Desulfonema magnum]